MGFKKLFVYFNFKIIMNNFSERMPINELTELEMRRKLLHVFAGSAFAILIKELLKDYAWHGIFSALVFLLISGAAISFAYIKGIEIPFFYWLIENFEREKDKKKLPGKGVFMFLLGSALTIAIFREPRVVAAALLIVSLGDGFATIFGLRFGRHRLRYNNKKTIEGSIAFLIFAFLGAITQVSLKIAFLSSFICMFFESFDLRVDDNLLIPLIAGAVIYIA